VPILSLVQVPPAELEALLVAHPSIADAAVVP
jgi:acyl-coenzyme A synthetase/AMP-(fatty) acid ligase